MSNPVYGKKAAPSRNAEKLSGALWTLVVGFIVFLVWTPFQVALFNGQQIDFEKPIYIAVLLGCLLLIGWIGIFFTKFRLNDERDLLAVLVLLLPLTYLLSMFAAASHYMAVNLLLIQSMYAAVFIVSLYLLRHKQINVTIQNAVLTVAYVLVWFGMLNWLGAWNVAGGIVGWFSNTVKGGRYLDAVMTDANGLRLTSVFQYANTYAAFLMAFLFVAIFALIRSRRWYGTLTHAFMLVPIIVSLLLTLSRGGLVMLPVVFVLLLLFLKPARQILWILHLGIAGIISLAITSPVTNIGERLSKVPDAGAAFRGWCWLLIGSAAAAALSWVIQKYLAPWLDGKLEGWTKRRLSGLWLPIGSTVLVGLVAFLLIGTGLRSILPANVETRLENINFKQHSVLERMTFYKDALKVVKDHPVIGTGGGGWASLYEQYQNNPYVSRQAHNFFLQYLIEVGIVGFLVFMGFILYIFYKYIRGYIKNRNELDDYSNGFFYLILTLSILLHSTLDFNLSYGFMGILVFLGLAGMADAMDSREVKPALKGNGIRYGYLAVLTVAAVTVLTVSGRSLSSNASTVEAKGLVRYSTSYEEIASPLQKALKLRPTHPESVLLLSALDQQIYKQTGQEEFAEKAHALLNKTLKKEPSNKQLLNQLVNLYDLKKEPELAYKVLLDNSYRFKWDINWYEQLISRASALGSEARAQKDSAKEQSYFQDALTAYDQVEAGIAHIKTLPKEQLQGRPFDVTPLIGMSISRIKELSGDSAGAAELLQTGFTGSYADLASQPEPWSPDWYSAVAARALELGQASRAQIGDGINDDAEEATMEANFGIGLQAYGYALNDAGGKESELPAPLALAAGKTQLLSGDFQEAINTFKGKLSDDYSDAVNRELARWYLGALKKANLVQDQDVYNKLIAADPNEAAQIDDVVKM
ncbi:polymerase [Paenibacillus spiritus]|uniref:Polymerase n=1 Tax=Paenibacillus spiritus TaxID=2496557 RepID=A0A5J5FUB1_9BACL|nr:polymerase [Paenibacillus spiritus]